MPRQWFALICLGLFLIGFSGCKQENWPVLNKITPNIVKRGPKYKTDYRMKLAVLPFEDTARFSGADFDFNVSGLVTERLAQSNRVVIVPYSQIEAHARQKGYPLPITQETVGMIGRDLGLNAVVMGFLSDVSQIQKRKGPLKFIPMKIPYLSREGDFVNAVLVARVVDVETGAILGSDIGEGETDTGQEPEFMDMRNPSLGVDKKVINTSLEEAVDSLAKGIVASLANTPWKGFVTQVSGNRITIAAGTDVGIESGDVFQVRAAGEKIVNKIGKTYVVPGPVKAELEAANVGGASTELTILSGEVHIGETVEALE